MHIIRRYMVNREHNICIAPIDIPNGNAQYFGNRDGWEEVTFEEWYPVFWDNSDYTSPCPLVPGEIQFWENQW